MPQMSDRWNLLKSLLLLAASLILVLTVLEAFARHKGSRRTSVNGTYHNKTWATFDQELGWRMQPGTWNVDILETPMTVLEDGSRLVPDSPYEDGAPVALLLGGSYMLGYGVGDDETLAAGLQQKLGNRMRVVNMAVPGYGTWQSCLMLRRYLQEHDQPPDVVIYGFARHHLIRNVCSTDWIRALASLKGVHIVPPHLRKGPEGEWQERPLEEINLTGLADDLTMVYFVQGKLLDALVDDNSDEARAATCYSLQCMEELCREHDIRFMAVNIFGKAMACEAPGTGQMLTCALPVRFMDRRWFLTKGETVSGHPNPDYYAAMAECIFRSLSTPSLAQGQIR